MLVKRINYVDYNGTERSENFYFNLSKSEITEMEIGTTGGMSAMLQKIVDEQDNKKIVEIFKDMILRSYGEKSADGRRFIKSAELSEAFSQTEAYSNLYMELASNSDAAAAFMNAIIPNEQNGKPVNK